VKQFHFPATQTNLGGSANVRIAEGESKRVTVRLAKVKGF